MTGADRLFEPPSAVGPIDRYVLEALSLHTGRDQLLDFTPLSSLLGELGFGAFAAIAEAEERIEWADVPRCRIRLCP